MASFSCHAVAVTKQVRLERIVRRQDNDASSLALAGQLAIPMTKNPPSAFVLASTTTLAAIFAEDPGADYQVNDTKTDAYCDANEQAAGNHV